MHVHAATRRRATQHRHPLCASVTPCHGLLRTHPHLAGLAVPRGCAAMGQAAVTTTVAVATAAVTAAATAAVPVVATAAATATVKATAKLTPKVAAEARVVIVVAVVAVAMFPPTTAPCVGQDCHRRCEARRTSSRCCFAMHTTIQCAMLGIVPLTWRFVVVRWLPSSTSVRAGTVSRTDRTPGGAPSLRSRWH